MLIKQNLMLYICCERIRNENARR